MWDQKRSKMIWKGVPRPLGVHKEVVFGHFELLSTHISPCKQAPQEALKMATLWLKRLRGVCAFFKNDPS